jgi:large conductance mechanosensitive channel
MPLQGFIDFIREKGVVGLAIGFMMGGAVSKLVTALVEDIINPLVGLALGKVGLAEASWKIGTAELKWGHFVSSIVDFIIIAAVIYFGFKLLRIDRLDTKVEPVVAK